MVDVSVVIVSFNTKDILQSCLASVLRYTKKVSFEVIVIDNNSQDGSAQTVHQVYGSKVKLLKNKKNVGFAKANNQGINKAKGRYILLLNSDTEIFNDSISKMVDWMDKNTNVGVSTCTLLNKNRTVQATGGYFPTLARVFLWSCFLDDLPFVGWLGSYHPHTSKLLGDFYRKEREVDWVTGAFFLLRREVADIVGGFDEDFFMYVEELEYCYRVKKAGWRVVYSPVTQIVHLRGASGISVNIIVGEFNGLRLFYSKHGNFGKRVILELFLKLAASLRMIIFGLILGRKEAIRAYAKAFV